MNPEVLFIETLEDLHRSISSSDEYEILRSSQLIRQLLLDGANSIVLQINRNYRLQIEYCFAEVTPPSGIPDLPTPDVWCVEDGLSPDSGSKTTSLKWEKFQKVVVASTGAHTHCIHDIIDYLAHIAGGVHLGVPQGDQQNALAGLHMRFPGMKVSAMAATLRAIARIVLNGLAELRRRVLNSARFENQPGLSIHMALVLLPMPGGQENYIIDMGVEVGRNRITLFLDAHGELCLRVFSQTGAMLTLKAGSNGGAYQYGVPLVICIEVGQCDDAVYVAAESSNWALSRVFEAGSGPSFSGEIPLVIGSDVQGRCQANMAILQHCLFTQIHPRESTLQLREFMERKILDLKACMHYEPGAFHHTRSHANFAHLPPRKSLESDAVLCWRGVVGWDMVSLAGPPPRQRAFPFA